MLALEGMGHEVEVICLRRAGERRHERIGTVQVRRLSLAHHRAGPLRYLYEYGVFLVLAGLLVSLRHLRSRYDLVQVHSMPDGLVLAALLPRLMGTPVILDLHECVPEFFATKFGWACATLPCAWSRWWSRPASASRARR